MNQPQHGFDEALISGYLDGELTQADAQRVRLHLEDCIECRAVADELAQLKEATMSSEFKIPDDGWDETPRGGASHLLRNAGAVVGLAWLFGMTLWLIWELANDPDALIGLLLVGGFLVSAGLLLASVIIDRRRTIKNDKYRRVQK
jgi:predicted anti-sigma-YlaC factor YlaD